MHEDPPCASRCRLPVHEVLLQLNEISQLLARFDSFPADFSQILGVAAKVVCMRSAIVIDNHCGVVKTTVWSAPETSEQSTTEALKHAQEASAHLQKLSPEEACELQKLGSLTSIPLCLPKSLSPSASCVQRYVTLPLVLNRSPIFGVLQVEAASPVSEEVVAFLSAVANQLAQALAHAYTLKLKHELSVQAAAATAANNAKSLFLANMSHELRTPLGAILGYTELLLSCETSEEEALQFGATIRRNGTLLARLIDDILDLAKVEAGKLEIVKVRFSLPGLIAEVRALFAQQARAKGLKFDVAIAADVPELVSSDPVRLKQILINILGNSLKFSERGTIKLSVSSPRCSSAEAEPALEINRQIIFAITDTGIGIAPEDAQRLFHRFVQADASTTRTFGGTGLGLALSRGLAIALGGDVSLVTSEPGVGSTFAVTIDSGVRDLPLREGNVPAGVKLDTAKVTKQRKAGVSSIAKLQHGTNVELQGESGLPLSDSRLSGKRILLVEDSPDLQMLFHHVLAGSGAHVDLQGDGVDGVSQALKVDYDVVIMDLQMPRCDGYQATAELRRRGVRTPILALSACAMAADRERALRAGCNEHLAKPVSAHMLVSVIAEISSARLH